MKAALEEGELVVQLKRCSNCGATMLTANVLWSLLDVS